MHIRAPGRRIVVRNLSCQLGMPVNEHGLTPADLGIEVDEGEFDIEDCTFYSGGCTFANGCSVARGEGWEYTECGANIFAWMLICEGQPASWGREPC